MLHQIHLVIDAHIAPERDAIKSKEKAVVMDVKRTFYSSNYEKRLTEKAKLREYIHINRNCVSIY